jgi:hypothetical protein
VNDDLTGLLENFFDPGLVGQDFSLQALVHALATIGEG